MNQAQYFHNEWREMFDARINRERDREKLLAKEQKEVTKEMIWQEYLTGRRSQAIADEYKVHLSTVRRIINEREKQHV